jgi:hypothetical protein
VTNPWGLSEEDRRTFAATPFEAPWTPSQNDDEPPLHRDVAIERVMRAATEFHAALFGAAALWAAGDKGAHI